MHKICFIQKKDTTTGPSMHQMQTGPSQDPFLKELITSLSVTDRPDLMIHRKYSEGSKKPSDQKSLKQRRQSTWTGKDEGVQPLTVTRN